jgi:hypothetical protein
MPEVYNHSRFLVDLARRYLPTESPCIGIEVGVWKGETSRYLLSEIQTLTLWLVDCWEPSPFHLARNQFSEMAKQRNKPEVFAMWERTARGNVQEFGKRASILKGDFRERADGIGDNSSDLVFLDASHSYQDTMEQLIWYTPKVRRGGIVAVHDYDWPRPGYEVVKEAVDAFCRFVGVKPSVDQGSYTAWWVK